MNPSSHSLHALLCIAIAMTALLSTQPTMAVAPPAHGERATVFDHRYSHNRNYPPRGHVVHELPRDAYVSRWHGATYYFHAGVWYRPARSHWMVVAPPVGVFVPRLPPFYTTIWIGGAPYYYANSVYYAWRPALGSYVVVEPPASDASVSEAISPSDLYVYPRNGQSNKRPIVTNATAGQWEKRVSILRSRQEA